MKRPWYRLHWLTYVVIAVVVLAFIDRQLLKRGVFGMANLGHLFETFEFGWPFAHMDYFETTPPIRSGATSGTEASYEWRIWQLVANCLVGILLVGSITFVCESWLRSQRRLQFSVRHLLIITAVIGVLLTFTREWELPYRGNENLILTWSLVSWSELIHPLRWPLLLAIACTIYSLGWLALALLRRAYSFVRR